MARIISLNQDPGIDPSRAKGAAVHVQSMRDAFRRCGANVIEIDSSDETDVAQRLNRLFGNGGVDLLYERYALGRSVGARVAPDYDVPYVVEVNAPLAEEHSRWRGVSESAQDLSHDTRIFGTATVSIAVSSAVAEYARRRGARHERVHVFRNGIDAQRFNFAARGRSVRSALGLYGQFVLGFHGRVRPWHGFERLVELQRGLLARGRRSHLLVVGEGCFDALRGLPAASFSHYRWQTHANMPGYVAACDVLPLAYDHDIPYYFSPLKLTEAMACGVVPVVPDVGDLARTVSHGETGLVYDAGDTRGLIQHIEWLIDNPREKLRIAKRAAAYASQFTWDEIARFVLSHASTTTRAGVARVG